MEKALIIDKIIERTQNLRKAIVKSIVENDPVHCPIADLNGKVEAFLKGDALSQSDEKLALDTLRSMTHGGDSPHKSATDCETVRSLWAHLDSLRVSVQHLTLTNAGRKKVCLDSSSATSYTFTFFVEYTVPEVIRRGRDQVCRVCSRKCVGDISAGQLIAFNHRTCHDVGGLSQAVNCANGTFQFKVTCRGYKQKSWNHLGVGSVHLSHLLQSSNSSLSYAIDVPIKTDSSIICTAHLRVVLEFGCGRLYFGNEIADAVKEQQSPKITPFCESARNSCVVAQKSSATIINAQVVNNTLTKDDILFGYFFVSRAHFVHDQAFSSFVKCQNFDRVDYSQSRTVYNSVQPQYHFHQKVPLVYGKELLDRLRENFLAVEFWKKGKTRPFLFGLAKLSLHQFYLAYRNPIICTYLHQKTDPIIAADLSWEPIYSITDEEEIVGEFEVLLAIGTLEQIRHLESQVIQKHSQIQACAKRPICSKQTIKSPKKKQLVDASVQTDSISSRIVKQGFGSRRIGDTKAGMDSKKNAACHDTNRQLRKTSELLESLQRALSLDEEPQSAAPSISGINTGTTVIDDNMPTLLLPIEVCLNGANINLDCCPKKKRHGQHPKVSAVTDTPQPLIYVTFETPKDGCKRSTTAVNKSSTWSWKCNVSIDADYIRTDTNKRLVFRVWHQQTSGSDLPVGVAVVELGVLRAGLPNIQGWFNVLDVGGQVIGQINVHVTPVENAVWDRFIGPRRRQQNGAVISAEQMGIHNNNDDDSFLSRALKRKFGELDEISQRLRLRLAKVTDDIIEEAQEEDVDGDDDDEASEQFQRDINTFCVEEDFDMSKLKGFTDAHATQELDAIMSTDKKVAVSGGVSGSSQFVSECSTSREWNSRSTSMLDRGTQDSGFHQPPAKDRELAPDTSFSRMLNQLMDHVETMKQHQNDAGAAVGGDLASHQCSNSGSRKPECNGGMEPDDDGTIHTPTKG